MIAELIARLRGDSSSWDAMMNRSTRSVTDFKSHVGTIAPALATVFSAAGAIAFTKQMAEAGAQIEKMAKTTGLSAEGIQRMHFAAKETETAVESLDKSLVRMQRNQVEALRNSGGPQARAFADLAVTIEDLKSLKPEEMFLKMADGVANAKDQGVALDAVLAIMGKTGADAFGMLAQGREKLQAIMSQAPVIGNADVAALADMNRQMTAWGERLKVDVVPGLVDVIKAVRTLNETLSLMGRVAAEVFGKFPTPKNLRETKEVLSGLGDAYAKTVKDIWNPSEQAVKPPAFDKGGLEDAQAQKEAARQQNEDAKELQRLKDKEAEARRKAAEAQKTDDQKRRDLQQTIGSEGQRIMDARYRAQLAGKSLAEQEIEVEKERLKTAEAEAALAELNRRAAERQKRNAEELAHLEDEIARKRNRSNLEGISYAQRVLEMRKEFNRLLDEAERMAKSATTDEERIAARKKEMEAIKSGEDLEHLLKQGQHRGVETIANEFQRRGSVEKGLVLLPKTDPLILQLQREANTHLRNIDNALNKGRGAQQPTTAVYGP